MISKATVVSSAERRNFMSRFSYEY
jgi:hypothetical protein